MQWAIKFYRRAPAPPPLEGPFLGPPPLHPVLPIVSSPNRLPRAVQQREGARWAPQLQGRKRAGPYSPGGVQNLPLRGKKKKTGARRAGQSQGGPPTSTGEGTSASSGEGSGPHSLRPPPQLALLPALHPRPLSTQPYQRPPCWGEPRFRDRGLLSQNKSSPPPEGEPPDLAPSIPSLSKPGASCREKGPDCLRPDLRAPRFPSGRTPAPLTWVAAPSPLQAPDGLPYPGSGPGGVLACNGGEGSPELEDGCPKMQPSERTDRTARGAAGRGGKGRGREGRRAEEGCGRRGCPAARP